MGIDKNCFLTLSCHAGQNMNVVSQCKSFWKPGVADLSF